MFCCTWNLKMVVSKRHLLFQRLPLQKIEDLCNWSQKSMPFLWLPTNHLDFLLGHGKVHRYQCHPLRIPKQLVLECGRSLLADALVWHQRSGLVETNENATNPVKMDDHMVHTTCGPTDADGSPLSDSRSIYSTPGFSGASYHSAPYCASKR